MGVRRAGNRRHGEAGFTLIEVLIALAITMLSLGLLYAGTASASSTARSTVAWNGAISRAQSHLAAIDNPGAATGERRGDDGDGYRWTTRVNLVRTAAPPRAGQGGSWSRGTALYSVSVAVSWREGRSERSFVLDSAVLGPAPGAAP